MAHVQLQSGETKNYGCQQVFLVLFCAHPPFKIERKMSSDAAFQVVYEIFSQKHAEYILINEMFF